MKLVVTGVRSTRSKVVETSKLAFYSDKGARGNHAASFVNARVNLLKLLALALGTALAIHWQFFGHKQRSEVTGETAVVIITAPS